MKTVQKMDTKLWAFSRFTTVAAHFHRFFFFWWSLEKMEKSEDAFQCFNRLLLQVGTAVYVPPLP
jgi:hypothetical protein